MTKKAGKLNANKPLGEGPDCREHGTKWKTGVHGMLTPDIVRKFAAKGMSVEQIGYLHGCTPQNIRHAIVHDEELKQAWCEGLSRLMDKATNVIDHHLNENNLLAAMYVTKCIRLPGEKGWIEQQYIRDDNSNGNQIEVKVYLPDNNREKPAIDVDPPY